MVVYMRMKKRIFKATFSWILRILLRLLNGIVFLGRGIRFCISGIFVKIFAALIRAIVPVVPFFYLKGRVIKKNLQVKFSKWNGLSMLGSRYLVHGLVILLVLFTSMPALSAADAPPGVFGEGTLLKGLLGEEELVVDDVMPSPEILDSYLEARFQNQQLPEDAKEPVEMPVALEGGTLLRPELPSTTILQTRTEVVEYEVQPGDTPWAIAEQFGISVATVLWSNNLNLWSTIRPGQKLTIPPVSGVLHTIKKGDTISAIAKRYNASAQEIQEFNNLIAEETLTLGQTLVIPGGRPYVAPQPLQVQRRVVQAPSPQAVVSTSTGQLVWPTPNSRRITQYFRWQHTGLDIGDRKGNPIVAADSGIVEYSGWGAGGWGYTIVLRHAGGMKTRYAHASKLLVQTGAQVNKGDTIALIGSTGRSTGPHLHFGVYINGRAVNPLKYIK